jgi:uncharacterized protein YodC (DUF2158 family)
MIESASDIESFSLQPGDVVRLKSGGPGMTIVAVKDDGIHCIWYADMTDDVRTAVIPAICLEPIDLDDLDDEIDDDDDDDDR